MWFLFRVVLEWYKSDLDARNKNPNKIDFYVSLTIGIIAIISIVYKLTSSYWIFSFPKIPFIILLVIGEYIAFTITINIESIVFIRQKEQSNKLGLSRIPYAVKALFYSNILFIPLALFVLLLTWIFIHYFGSEQVNLYWHIIILIPFIIRGIGLLVYFIFPNIKRRASLQAIFDQHEIAKGFEINPPDITKKEKICKPTNDEQYEGIFKELENGLSPNKIMHHGWTPFLFSIANGDMRLAKVFIEYGADINVKNTMGRSALHFAIRYNFSDFVELLIQHNVIVIIPSTSNYAKDPIIEAVIKGNLHIVKLLIEAGANINVLDSEGKRALQYAEENHFGEIAKILRNIENTNKS